MAAEPLYLWLLLLLIPMGLLFWYARKQGERDRAALGDSSLLSALLALQPRRRSIVRAVMLLCAMGLLVVALARPRWGQGSETVERTGLQVMILLDGSRSMAAQDIVPSRIERSKSLVLQLLNDLEGNQVGMMIFGSTSSMQFPLTSDLAAASTLVQPINPQNLSFGGTDIAGVIEDAVRSFPLGEIQGRTLLLITDGGDPDEARDLEAILQAREAAKVGLTIHTIGMATNEGGPIPEYGAFGEIGYVEDGSGNRVQSRLNEPLLQQIASATGGTYFAANSLDMEKLQLALQQGAPVDLSEQLNRRMQMERFYIFAGLALILLIGDVFVGQRGRSS